MAKVEIKYVVFTAVAGSGDFEPEILSSAEYSRMKKRKYNNEYKNLNPEKFDKEPNKYRDPFFLELYLSRINELLDLGGDE